MVAIIFSPTVGSLETLVQIHTIGFIPNFLLPINILKLSYACFWKTDQPLEIYVDSVSQTQQLKQGKVTLFRNIQNTGR